MADEPLQIQSSTKVGQLLDAYPELEEVLIKMAPPFKKLKNPILRKSIAKVATLQQAAMAKSQGTLPTSCLTVERTGKAVDSGNQQVDKAVKGVTDWFKKK